MPKMIKLSENDIVIQEGSITSCMYKIVSGKAIVFLNYGKDSEICLGVLKEEALFGEHAMLTGSPSPYTIVAYCELVLLQIEADGYETFFQENVYNAIDLMKNMSKTIAMLKTDLNLLMDEYMNENQKKEASNLMLKNARKYGYTDLRSSPYFKDLKGRE
ncbi:MAG: cyclic nucleotide-binding domain-containing protein [Lachnospiraceae bacterium]|nr:cyclic nucleotide-binding domain-containing protein [Lachnospiraceae bacterium]